MEDQDSGIIIAANGEFQDEGRAIPPESHYPNWKYYCPLCKTWWEEHWYHRNYVHACDTCKAKWPPPEARHDQEPYVRAAR